MQNGCAQVVLVKFQYRYGFDTDDDKTVILLNRRWTVYSSCSVVAD